MRQSHVLWIIAHEHGEQVWGGMPVRGQHTFYASGADVTLPFRVVDRLVELGDLEYRNEWGGINDLYVCLTEQGRRRLRKAHEPTEPIR